MKQKCEKCKMHHQGFHICLDFFEYTEANPAPMTATKGKRTSVISDAARQGAAAAQRGRWDRATGARNKMIVDLYKTGTYSTSSVAKEVECSQATVIKILHQAADRGEVTMRKRGHTIAKGAK